MITQEQRYKLKMKLTVLFMVLWFFTFHITTVQAYSPIIPTVPEVVEPEEPEIQLTPVGDPLTPEGNLTLVDDVFTNNENDKQFITAISKSGHYFYLVIDRAGDNDNVYLLNMVDEADLMALMYDEPVDVTYSLQTEEAEPEPEPEPVPEPEPEPEITEEPTEETASILPLILMVGLIGGGAFYFLKIKPSQTPRGNPLLDEFDDEDEDEEEELDD